MTALHGSWHIDEHGRLIIEFNCREGTPSSRSESRGSASHHREGLPLHPTVLWRGHAFIDTPDSSADWAGTDDKDCDIWLCHRKSLQEIKEIGQRPSYLRIPQL